MPNKKFYDEYPIHHQYPKYPINVQAIQVKDDQLMTVKEAINFLFLLEVIPLRLSPSILKIF